MSHLPQDRPPTDDPVGHARWRRRRWQWTALALALLAYVALVDARSALRAGLALGSGATASPQPSVSPSPTPSATATAAKRPSTLEPTVITVLRRGVARDGGGANISLHTGRRDAVVMGFAPTALAARCVGKATLEASVLEADPAELAVELLAAARQSALEATADGADSSVVRASPQPVPAAPLAFTDGTPGRLRWDVTPLVRSWTAREQPALTKVPEDAPLAVRVRATRARTGESVRFAGGGSRQAPTLRLSVRGDCPS